MAKRPDVEELVPDLCVAIKRARLTLRRARENHVDMVRRYVGPYWSEQGYEKTQPLNLIGMYVDIMTRALIAKNPRVMLSTFQRSLKPTVKAMESWANDEIIRLNLQNTLARAVVDALFTIGIVKVALTTPPESASVSWRHTAGQVGVWPIHLDDWVYDTHTRNMPDYGYMGHRYRVPLEVAKEFKHFKKKSRQLLEASPDSLYNQEGDERISVMGRGLYESDSQEFRPMTDLWEIYIPEYRAVLTLPDQQIMGGGNPGEDLLRVEGYIGPDEGPYHILGYGYVPGNAMPKGPIQDLVDLHDNNNRAFRKLMRMAQRIKEQLLVSGGAIDDAQRIMAGDDGEIIPVQNLKNLQQVVWGGQALQQLGMIETLTKDRFDWLGGNLSLQGGLGPQSKTLGQDELLRQSAGAGVSDKQETTLKWVEGIIRSCCWYWKHDPFKVQSSTHQLPGLPDFQIQRHVTPQMRSQVPWDLLDVKVDPYSMQHQTPQTKLASINQVVSQIVIPMMQIAVQQGIAFDMNAYLQKVAQYMDQPDLAEILTIQEPPDQSGKSGGSARTMPQQTKRQYERINRSGRTDQGDDKNLMYAMLGKNPGGAQQPQLNGAAQ